MRLITGGTHLFIFEYNEEKIEIDNMYINNLMCSLNYM